MSRAKFIVTGSEGFIGKALVAFLRHRGASVVCVDRAPGTEVSDIESVIMSELENKEDGELRCVFHLAAQTSVFNRDTRQILNDNIAAFIAVCDSCARHNVRLVYASSSTAADGNTTSMYGISKRFNEEYARCHHPLACGIRFHNVYGPEPRQGTLLWYLMHDEVVTLYNGGDNIRHFTYIDDAVEGLWYAYANFVHGVVNVANPEQYRIWEFARAVSEYNGVKIVFERTIRDRDNSTQSLDNSKVLLPLQYRTVQEGLGAIFGE